MSVYIKGMKMPWCEHQEIDIRRGTDGKWYAIDGDWYEIIPVPDHGRLIDADALKISTAVPLNGKSYLYVHKNNIDNAPTIIPADKEAGE